MISTTAIVILSVFSGIIIGWLALSLILRPIIKGAFDAVTNRRN